MIEENAMLMDVPSKVMNGGTIHTEDIRSNLPAVYYRKVNQPIPSSKTLTEERTFTATHFESKSTIDVAAAKRGGISRIAYNRWNQAMGHLQAHAQELADVMLYGSPLTSNLKTAGFFDIYSTLATSEETSKQIVDAGGVGSDNCSILKVHWGDRSVFGIYPEGTSYGITRDDKSVGNKEVQVLGTDENAATGHFWGYEEDFMTDHGLVVKDYRQCCRIANIDVSDLIAGSGADLIDLMISGNYLIDSLENGTGVWYVNRTIQAALHKQSLTKVGAGAGLSYENYQGRPTLMFLGSPVRRMDALLTSEEAITV